MSQSPKKFVHILYWNFLNAAIILVDQIRKTTTIFYLTFILISLLEMYKKILFIVVRMSINVIGFTWNTETPAKLETETTKPLKSCHFSVLKEEISELQCFTSQNKRIWSFQAQ